MARPKELIDVELVQRAREELRKRPDQKLGLRLQAIISCLDHSITEVSSVMGVTRQTVTRWIKNFRRAGAAGLADRPKGHAPSKLNTSHQAEIARWLSEGRNCRGQAIHWTLALLAGEIEAVWGIRITTMPLWRHLRRMGFRLKVPRPVHASADPEKQAAFKKNGGVGRGGF